MNFSILKPFQGQPNIHYLEIGVSEGRSALWMLENILTHPTAKITCLDIFVKDLYERFLSNLILSGFLDKAIIVKGKSQTTLRTLPLDTYDIVYVD
jgi:predicted O-methyltransferase YrrM